MGFIVVQMCDSPTSFILPSFFKTGFVDVCSAFTLSDNVFSKEGMNFGGLLFLGSVSKIKVRQSMGGQGKDDGRLC
jgi:hypothetical protein